MASFYDGFLSRWLLAAGLAEWFSGLGIGAVMNHYRFQLLRPPRHSITFTEMVLEVTISAGLMAIALMTFGWRLTRRRLPKKFVDQVRALPPVPHLSWRVATLAMRDGSTLTGVMVLGGGYVRSSDVEGVDLDEVVEVRPGVVPRDDRWRR